MTLTLKSPAISAESDWVSIRPMAKGIISMNLASKTIFDGLRAKIRLFGLSNMISATASGTYAYGSGTVQVKSGTYYINTGIATGKTFKYILLIKGSDSAYKLIMYFNDIELPYSKEALIVLVPEYFASSTPTGTRLEMYCYKDGTIPSMKISLTYGTLYKIRALAQEESDVYEVSAFFYLTLPPNTYDGYYTLSYASKKTGSYYTTAMQGALAATATNTPSNNGYGYVTSTTSVNHGRFYVDGTTGTWKDDMKSDAGTDYPAIATIDSIYSSMNSSGLLSFFNNSDNLIGLTIDLANSNYPK